jgi:hypothetical protein
MARMKTAMKISLIIIGLALLTCLVVLISRPARPVAANVSDTSRGPSFEVNVVKPLVARPLFGLIPEEKLRFDHTSRGAMIGSVGHDRLELRADGWDIFIETDGEGGIAPGTRLLFPIELAGRQRSLRCRPADPASGYFSATTRAGSDQLDGSFQVELATCENAETGKAIEWPPAPLTVSGSFEGLPYDRR